MDPSTDDELFGSKSDSSSIVSKLSDTHMEDVTRATNCIFLTDDTTEGYEKIDDNQSSSVQAVPNLTVCRKLTNFLKELEGLTVCPIIQLKMTNQYGYRLSIR